MSVDVDMVLALPPTGVTSSDAGRRGGGVPGGVRGGGGPGRGQN